MKHAGSDVVSLTGTLGKVADLTVEENDQRFRFVPFKPFPAGARQNGVSRGDVSAENGNEELEGV